MKKISLLLVLAVAMIMAWAAVAQALTLNVNPSRVRIGSAITATVRATYTTAPLACANQVNFGDGTGWQYLTSCNTKGCTKTLGHTFAATGTYTVRVRADSTPSCAALLNPPTTAATTANVCSKLAFSGSSRLPGARQGVAYSQRLSVTSGGQRVTYQVFTGSLPQGLSLASDGVISGTPTASGNFSFGVRAIDACGGTALAVKRMYSLAVDAVQFSGSASPASAQVRPDAATAVNVRHNLRSTASVTTTLTSASGSFVAGGRTLGTVNRALNVNFSGGSGSVAETVTVPASVVQQMHDWGANNLQYRRTFNYNGVNVAETSIRLNPMQKALGLLRVRKLRLFFDNRRPEITVKRFATGLRATAAITYEGSGQLMAYWEVDGRVIAHENMNLIYGKRSIELQSPQTPALPTFSQGTHRVRLVITSPSMDIDWPVAIYYVETAKAAEVVPIAKIQPPCGSHRPYAAVAFSWGEVKGAGLYVLDFLTQEDDKPFFSAQVKQPAYHLPAVLLKKYFKPGAAYVWRVRALDAQGAVTGESNACGLNFKP